MPTKKWGADTWAILIIWTIAIVAVGGWYGYQSAPE